MGIQPVIWPINGVKLGWDTYYISSVEHVGVGQAIRAWINPLSCCINHPFCKVDHFEPYGCVWKWRIPVMWQLYWEIWLWTMGASGRLFRRKSYEWVDEDSQNQEPEFEGFDLKPYEGYFWWPYVLGTSQLASISPVGCTSSLFHS